MAKTSKTETRDPESADALLGGFQGLLEKVVPVVASASVEPSLRAAQEHWAKELSDAAERMQAQLDASLLTIQSTFETTNADLASATEDFRAVVGDEQNVLEKAVAKYKDETQRIGNELNQFAVAARTAISGAEGCNAELAGVVQKGEALALQTSALLKRQEELNAHLDAALRTTSKEVAQIHAQSAKNIKALEDAIAALGIDFVKYTAQLNKYSKDLATLMRRATSDFERARSSLLFGLSPRAVLVFLVVLHFFEIGAAVLFYVFYVRGG